MRRAPPPEVSAPPTPQPSASSSPAPSCAPETLRRGLALTLEQARQAQISDAQMEGCARAPLRCGTEVLDLAPGPCRARIVSDPDVTRFALLLAPRDGAPVQWEVWMDPQATRAGNVFRAGSTWASSPDSSLLLRGETSHAIHTHGGAPASIGTVTIVAYNQGKTPRTVRLQGATWNTSHGAPVPLENVHFYRQTTPSEQVQELPLPPGATTLHLAFTPKSAYQSWGQLFFVETRLLVEGQTLAPRSEIRVTRVEPLRR